MERPKVSAATLAAATETLAHWIAGGWTTVAAQVGTWGDAEWQSAAWIAYWQGAIPLWVERLREANLTGRTGLARVFQVAELSHLRTEQMLCDAREMIAGLWALGIESAPLKGARVAPFYYRP